METAIEKNILIIENDHEYINKLGNVFKTLSVEYPNHLINVSNALHRDDFKKIGVGNFEVVFIGYDFLLIEKEPIKDILKRNKPKQVVIVLPEVNKHIISELTELAKSHENLAEEYLLKNKFSDGLIYKFVKSLVIDNRLNYA